MKPMTIGRLSKEAGVKVTTIRYYESIGLMGEPDRSDSGQRQYGDEAVQRLSFIRVTMTYLFLLLLMMSS